jgi:hypothetical protein
MVKQKRKHLRSYKKKHHSAGVIRHSAGVIRPFAGYQCQSPLNAFYLKCLATNGIFLEEAVNKRPITSKANRVHINTIELIQQVLSFPGKDILISLTHTNIIAFDFDFHKISNADEREAVNNKILQLAKHYNITTVRSKSGGLHLYFDKDNVEFKTIIGTTLTCLIPMVDVLTDKIIGPNLNDRKVIS